MALDKGDDEAAGMKNNRTKYICQAIQVIGILHIWRNGARNNGRSSMENEIKNSLRMLGKNPGFTVAALAALAIGIGANTAIFSVVNTVLLKPLTYPDADRVVKFLSPSTEIANDLHNIPEFHFLQRQTNLFKVVVAFDNAGPGFNLTGGSRPEQVNGIHVTQGYFRVYGAPLALGRTFTPRRTRPMVATSLS